MVVTAFVFGLRHGIDWDHLAAITDLTGAQSTPRRSMLVATCYALGHGAVVFVLGVAAVVFAERLPGGVDTVMERVVGATLLLLGVYVLVSLSRHGRDFRMRSRWMLVIAAGRRAVSAMRARGGRTRPQEFLVIEHEHPHRHDIDHGHTHHATSVGAGGAVHAHEPATDPAADPAHRHRHRHVLPVPSDPFAGPGLRGAVGIGALHGVGAETPTQVVVFVGAAGASGPIAGLCMLVSFIVGLLVSNTAVAAITTFGRVTSARRFAVYATISALTAGFSLVMGALFVTGRADSLPGILG
jgi:high-affinity nickel-transport protein